MTDIPTSVLSLGSPSKVPQAAQLISAPSASTGGKSNDLGDFIALLKDNSSLESSENKPKEDTNDTIADPEKAPLDPEALATPVPNARPVTDLGEDTGSEVPNKVIPAAMKTGFASGPQLHLNVSQSTSQTNHPADESRKDSNLGNTVVSPIPTKEPSAFEVPMRSPTLKISERTVQKTPAAEVKPPENATRLNQPMIARVEQETKPISAATQKSPGSNNSSRDTGISGSQLVKTNSDLKKSEQPVLGQSPRTALPNPDYQIASIPAEPRKPPTVAIRPLLSPIYQTPLGQQPPQATTTESDVGTTSQLPTPTPSTTPAPPIAFNSSPKATSAPAVTAISEAIKELTAVEDRIGGRILDLGSRLTSSSSVPHFQQQITPHSQAEARSIATQMVSHFATQTSKTTVIRLDPEELGQVRMTLRSTENGMTMIVVAERPETADVMRRNLQELAQEFQSLGFENLDFHFGGQTSDGHSEGQTENASVSVQDDAQITVPPASTQQPDGRLDIRF